MLESEVEKKLKTRVQKELNGLALKFVSPGFNGVPDRIILVPYGRIYFVETKAPNKNTMQTGLKILISFFILFTI